MGEFKVEGAELKKLLKAAESKPVSFGFNPGKTEQESYLGLHKLKQPKQLGKDAKESGTAPQFAFGTVTLEGRLLTLNAEREIPQLAKRLKKYLKTQKILFNVEVRDAAGNLLEADVEEALPEDVTEADASDETVAQSAAPPDPAEVKALASKLAALKSAIAEAPEEMRDRLMAVLGQALARLKAGELGAAGETITKLEAAIARVLQSAKPKLAQPNPEQPNPEQPKSTASKSAQPEPAKPGSERAGAPDKVAQFLAKLEPQIAAFVAADPARQGDVRSLISAARSGGDEALRANAAKALAALLQSKPEAAAPVPDPGFQALAKRVAQVSKTQPQARRQLEGLLGAAKAAFDDGDAQEMRRQLSMLTERLETWEQARPLPDLNKILDEGLMAMSRDLAPEAAAEMDAEASAGLSDVIAGLPDSVRDYAAAYTSEIAKLRARGDSLVKRIDKGGLDPKARAAHHYEIDQICLRIEKRTQEMTALMKKEALI